MAAWFHGSFRRSFAPGGARGILGAALLLAACGGDVESRMVEVRALQDVGQFTTSIEELREILAIDPEYAEASYRLGLALVQTGERSRAIWPLQKAAESPQYAAQAGQLLARVHLDSQEFEEALRAIDRVLEIDPNRNMALELRAKANIGAKRFADALADSERLIALFPDDYAAHAIYATTLLDSGRLDESEAAHARLKELGSKSGDPELEARGCIAPALFAREQRKDLVRAEELFDDCLERFSTHPLVLTQAAEALDDAKKPERVIAIYRRAVEQAPERLGLRATLAARLADGGATEEAERVLAEAAETFGSAQAWNLLVDFHRRQGNPQRALEAIEKVVEVSGGGDDGVHFTQADLLVDLGELERAESIAAGLREATYATLIRGRILMAKGDPKGALAAFDLGIRNWPNNAAARYLAGLAARELGDFERAISELRESVRADKDGTDAAMVLARLYFDRGDYEKVLTYANWYVQFRPDAQREAALRLSARSLAALGRYSDARRSIALLQGLPGGRLPAAVELAVVERQEKGAEAAVRGIEKSGFDLTDPAHEELLRELAENLVTAGRVDEAQARIAAAVARSPQSGSLLELQATLLARARRTEEATRVFEKALAMDPDNAAALGGLATMRVSAGDRAAAIELFDRASSLAPDQLQFAYAASQLSLAAGDAEGAERRLRDIVRRSPRHSGARNDLAWILSEKGEELDLALALAKEAERLDPSANILDTVGWVHLKRGEVDRAIAVLEQAVELAPANVSIRAHLAEALQQAGESERAQKTLAGALPELGTTKAP